MSTSCPSGLWSDLERFPVFRRSVTKVQELCGMSRLTLHKDRYHLTCAFSGNVLWKSLWKNWTPFFASTENIWEGSAVALSLGTAAQF